MPKNTKIMVRAMVFGASLSSLIVSCAGRPPDAPTCGPCCHGDESACRQEAEAAREVEALDEEEDLRGALVEEPSAGGETEDEGAPAP